MARRDIDPASQWQTACWLYRWTHIPATTVQKLALQGLVRVKIDHSRYPSFFYSVADINRWIQEARRDGLPEATRFRMVETVETAAPRPKARARAAR
jgi:hypothetical protein